MKRQFCLIIVALQTVLLNSCAQTTVENVEGMINPGDEIDGMLFTTTDEVDWDLSLAFLCDFDSNGETGTTAGTCFASPGGSVFFGNFNGVPYNNPEEAEEPWREVESEVTFDGKALNLPAFGYLETDLYDSEWKYVRLWNLMVENLTTGTHTIQTVWEHPSEGTFKSSYVFTVSEQLENFPTLSAKATLGINPYTSEKVKLNYLLYLPGEYGVDPDRKWPLLIYLHGMTRVNTSVKVLKNDYPLNSLADQDFFPFIVVAPQGTGEYEFWATDEMIASIMTLLDEIQGVLMVDPNRIYLTGVSAGGNGAWSIGLRHPERFAAIMSAMGYYGWPPTVPENICDLSDVPVRAFHGAKDEIVPLEAEQMLVDALEDCGGEVQFSVFPESGHDLASEQFYTPELYEWLLSHSLK